WFKTVYPEISAVNLGDSFNGVLALLTAVERAYKWREDPGKGIGGKDRPSQVSSWIAMARGGRKKKGETGPGVYINSLAVFEREWRKWWGSLQPSWREKDVGTPGRFTRETYGDGGWKTLRHAGQNGVLNVVASLYWWGLTTEASGTMREDRESWAEAVTDVKWMLRGLLAAELGVGIE
ncbi:hypothetical protein C8F04DRAFT_974239, partial [Mycena alexandri]